MTPNNTKPTELFRLLYIKHRLEHELFIIKKVIYWGYELESDDEEERERWESQDLARIELLTQRIKKISKIIDEKHQKTTI